MTKQIETLQKPINDMTDEELVSRIHELREEAKLSRTHESLRVAKQASVVKTVKKRVDKNVEGMTPEQAAALLVMLTGGSGDGKEDAPASGADTDEGSDPAPSEACEADHGRDPEPGEPATGSSGDAELGADGSSEGDAQ